MIQIIMTCLLPLASLPRSVKTKPAEQMENRPGFTKRWKRSEKIHLMEVIGKLRDVFRNYSVIGRQWRQDTSPLFSTFFSPFCWIRKRGETKTPCVYVYQSVITHFLHCFKKMTISWQCGWNRNRCNGRRKCNEFNLSWLQSVILLQW